MIEIRNPTPEGVRAGNTLKWLENSGPRYAEIMVRVVKLYEDKLHCVINTTGEPAVIAQGQMSFASWLICQENQREGNTLILKIRTDPVAHSPLSAYA